MKHFQNKGLSLRSLAGFSITELMVVVVIIGILSAMAVPRIRQFIASARQGEAKTNVGLISKLQHLHMSAHERYLAMGVVPSGDNTGSTDTGAVGYVDTDITDATAGTRSCNDTVARRIGFRPSGCNEFRYSYWVRVGTYNGIDRFMVGAYAPSSTDARIFPTCDGSTVGDTATARTGITLTHSITGASALNIATPGHGDMWAMDDQRRLYSDDIITVCTGAAGSGDNVGAQ